MNAVIADLRVVQANIRIIERGIKNPPSSMTKDELVEAEERLKKARAAEQRALLLLELNGVKI